MGPTGLINMAYDASLNSDVAVAPVAFRRDERFAVLFGGAAVGIAAGFGIAMALGRTGDDGQDFDDGSSRTKRLRVVSTFEYELR